MKDYRMIPSFYPGCNFILLQCEGIIFPLPRGNTILHTQRSDKPHINPCIKFKNHRIETNKFYLYKLYYFDRIILTNNELSTNNKKETLFILFCTSSNR